MRSGRPDVFHRLRRATGGTPPARSRGTPVGRKKRVGITCRVSPRSCSARGESARSERRGLGPVYFISDGGRGLYAYMYHPISQTQTVNMLLACGPLPMLGPGAPFTFIAHIMRCLWITAASEQAACRAAGWRVKSAISHCRPAVVSRPSTGPPVGHQAPVCGRQDLVKVIVC